MCNGSNASAVNAAMGNGSMASAMPDEGIPVKMEVKAVESAMSNGSNASAVKAAMGNGNIASARLDGGKPVTMLGKAI